MSDVNIPTSDPASGFSVPNLPAPSTGEDGAPIEADGIIDTPDFGTDEDVETEAPETPFSFDQIVEQFGDQMVPVTVDGETIEVPLSDLTKGYQRQADYTKKTQAAAAQAKEAQSAMEIVTALKNDPKGFAEQVLQLSGGGQDPAAQFPSEALGAQPSVVEERIRELEMRQWAEQTNRKLMDQHAQYKDVVGEYNLEEVVQQMEATGNYDPTTATVTYLFPRILSELQAMKARQTAVDGDQARTEAKQGTDVVGASGATSTGAPGAKSNGRLSIEDAVNLAFQGL